MSTVAKTITDLVSYLNKCRDAYYNASRPLISDAEYDKLFDELEKLENESGIILSNSPTQSVGYPVVSSLAKVKHKYPLLSLEKTKTADGISRFCASGDTLFMHKLDGLTCQLTYVDGKLVRAETRGDGIEGEVITHNTGSISGIPLTIPYTGEILITGEAIIKDDDFMAVNDTLEEQDKFANSRNLVSGSVRQFDSRICKERRVTFVVWNANDISEDGTMVNGLDNADKCGFYTVHRALITGSRTKEQYETICNNMRSRAKTDNIPIDGIVLMYNSISYGKSLGSTSHHPRNGIAYKFYDNDYVTTVTDIEYTIGKSGVLTPTAVFNPVDMEGVTVTRASVHNLSILEHLNLCIGDTVDVYRSNDVIPQIRKNRITHSDSTEYTRSIPHTCPYCGAETKTVQQYDSKVLVCTNTACSGKLLKKFSAFVSKGAMDIDGLSEKTLSKFINAGFIKSYEDIYTLIEKHGAEIVAMDGFGDKSVTALDTAINKSKNTSLAKILMALSIPGVGKQVGIQLSDYFNNNAEAICKMLDNDTDDTIVYKLSSIPGFGDIMAFSFVNWFRVPENRADFENVLKYLTIETTKQEPAGSKLAGMNFVITGSLKTYQNRNALVDTIESNGGKVQSGVTAATTYLINNDIESSSSKNKTAKRLGIKIITEEQFNALLAGEKPVMPAGPKKLF